jgi:hypothetical protein
MPEPSNGPAAPAGATATGQDPAGHTGGGAAAKPGDTRFQLANVWLQLVSLVVSLAALGVAIFAALNSDSAASTANRLAAKVASASLRLAAPLHERPLSGGRYEVTLKLTNQGGGDAQAINASLGALANIHNVSFAVTCPPPLTSVPFIFQLGKTLGANDRLAGTATVLSTDLPAGGRPTDSMALYVSWQNNDGSTTTNCENLSNNSTIGNLLTGHR